MKKILPILLLIAQPVFSQSMQFINLPENVNSSFRGLSVVNNNVAWICGSNGFFGRTTDGGMTWLFARVKGFEKNDFRSLYAFDEKTAVIANAGSPAFILRTDDAGKNWKTVYKNYDTLAFFDGIDFWNNREGIIYGDPIGGRLVLLHTNDGGKHWQPAPDNNRPLMTGGEASFAASGTAIRCYAGGKVFIATGGIVSRLLLSENYGQNWRSIDLPAIQGKSTTGIFSVAFTSDTAGIIVGGDYTKDDLMINHVFFTYDGGAGWVPSYTLTGGFRECVEFIDYNTAFAVGPAGFDITFDCGREWSTFSIEKGFHVIRKARNGNLVIAAGNKRIGIINH